MLPKPPSFGSRRAFRGALTWVGVAVTVLFLYLALRDIDASEAWATARRATFAWLVPSAVVLAAAVVVRAERWRLLFPPGSRPRRSTALAAYLVGQLFNNVLPLRAGEAARVVALVRKTGGAPGEAAATVVLERLLDVLSLLAVLFVCLPWLPHIAWLRAAAVLGLALVLAVAVVAVLLARFGDRPIAVALAPLGALPGFDGARRAAVARSVGHGLAGLRSPALAAAACALTVGSWLALAASFWLLAFAFHLHVPYLAAVLVAVTTNLGQVIPSSPAAVGVFEGATLLALGAYGVDRSPALSYAVALHLLNLVPYLLCGAAALRFAPVASLSSLRKASSEREAA